MMRYMLKENSANTIKEKFKNSYFVNNMGLSESYVSLIINRRVALPKNTAYMFTKMVNSEYEISDLFDRVK